VAASDPAGVVDAVVWTASEEAVKRASKTRRAALARGGRGTGGGGAGQKHGTSRGRFDGLGARAALVAGPASLVGSAVGESASQTELRRRSHLPNGSSVGSRRTVGPGPWRDAAVGVAVAHAGPDGDSLSG